MQEFEVKDPSNGRTLNKMIGVEFKEKTDTTYTVALGDHSDCLDMNNAATITVTLPDSIPVGFHCNIRKTGVGNVVLAAATTLESASSFTTLSTQHAGCTIMKKSATVWVAFGLEI